MISATIRTPPAAADTSRPMPKLSEIIAAELAGNFFADIDVGRLLEGGNSNSSNNQSQNYVEMDDLIQLSRQMQRDIASGLSLGGDVGGCLATLQPGVAGVVAGVVADGARGARQPSGTTHRAFLVPPLFLDDADILDSYTRDLVAECFERANRPRRLDAGVQHQEASPAMVPEPVPSTPPPPPRNRRPAGLELDLSALRTGSVKSALSTRTYTARPYPRRHSCLHQMAAVAPARKLVEKRHQFSQPRRTKSARLPRSDYFDFARVHPDLAIVESDSVFPRRVPHAETETVPSVAEQELQPEEPENPAEPEVASETRETVAEIVEKFEGSQREASVSKTWHEVLEINLAKLSARKSRLLDQPTQTSPLSAARTAQVDQQEEPLPPINQCAVQILPPLNIRATCRIQNLPHVSITGPNFAAVPGTYAGTDDNNRYIEIVHGEIVIPPTEEAREPTEPQSKPAEIIPDERTLQTSTLQITAISTESYGDEQKLTTTSSSTNVEDELSSEVPYSSAFEPDASTTYRPQSALDTSKTDDEKIKSAHRGAQKVPSKRNYTRRSTPKVPTRKAKKVEGITPPIGEPQQYTDNVMRIIDEIFETTPNENTAPAVPKPNSLFLNVTHDSFNIPAAPQNVQQTVGIQTTPKSSSVMASVHEVVQKSATLSPTTSVFNSLLTTECQREIEEASEEHVRITDVVFAQIRERKAARYLSRGAQLELGFEAPDDQRQPSAPSGCQHNAFITQSLTNTLARYPDLRKFFMPEEANHAESEAHQSPTKPAPTALTPTATTLPSVRLQNLRKLQHQQLLAQHPQVQRTIDSIRRDAANSTRLSESFRMEHGPEKIQEAAERFLHSVRSPKRQAAGLQLLPPVYVDDPVQQEADIYLMSLASSTSTSCKKDLFKTDSSSYDQTTEKSSAELLCTVSEQTTSTRESRLLTDSITSTSPENVSSVLVSPLKLSRTHSLQTTDTTSGPVAGQSTTSSMEKHMTLLAQQDRNEN